MTHLRKINPKHRQFCPIYLAIRQNTPIKKQFIPFPAAVTTLPLHRQKNMDMNKMKLKTGKVEEKVVGAYKTIENGVVKGYQAIEDAVVGTYQKIEDKFVDKFLEIEEEVIEIPEEGDNK